ncbi:MAG: hypothetical protein CBD74_14370 [Saprospirales bacterium TMED214]|nr:MAG: hypothetical protein CBD74_14370 [Saprospirales bacterium TMED214]
MNRLYLVCTRAAISGSSLAYIINQSPDFYNVPHNNVWEQEACDTFGTAYTINDWWNLNDNITSALCYDQQIRNTEAITEQQLVKLANGYKELELGKNICLFVHARNIGQLKSYILKHDLPIVIISTLMGKKCGTFINSWIKREYSNEMNKFNNLFDTWEYLFTQRVSRDKEWAKHADYTFTMYDWLVDTQKIYDKLSIAEHNSINDWTTYYLKRNNSEVESLKDTCKKLSTMLQLYDILESQHAEHHDKITLCYNLFELVHASTEHATVESLQHQYNKTY